MSGVPTIDCPDCSGLTHTVSRCECVGGGDRLLVDGTEYADEPYRDCRLCQGDGSILRPCLWCGRTGARRAELVVSIVNLDTGAVASERIRPGGISPRQEPDGIWVLPLRPIVDRLAARVAVREVRGLPTVGPDPDDPLLWLPRRWGPELPTVQRYRIEAEALARADHTPWRVLLGRSAPPIAPPDPGRHLARLCQVANLLHLDLVVEARERYGQLRWEVRYELPGSGVPAEPYRSEAELSTAVVVSTVATAAARLGETGRTAPAYTVRSGLGVLPAPEVVDLAQLELWLRVDLGGAPGAQAIWRNGRWWHTRLREGNPVEVLHERDTGQVVRHATPRLHRVTEPPEPTWWGAPIRGHSALTVTVTDLTRAVYRLWQPTTAEPTTQVGVDPDGTPVRRLRGHYRAAGLAAPFGVPPEHLTRLDQPGGHPLDQHLLEGTVTDPAPGGGEKDPVRWYVTRAARGLPGARLFLLARPPEAPPVVELIRLACGLGLAATLVACDHRREAADPARLHGVRWRVDVVTVGAEPDLRPPWWPSLEAAVADCFAHLGPTLRDSLPADPHRPLPAPGLPRSPADRGPVPTPPGVPGESDPTSALRRLAHRYPGQVVAARVDRAGRRFWVADPTGPRALTDHPG